MDGTTSRLVAVHHRSSAAADDLWEKPWVGTLVGVRVPRNSAVGGIPTASTEGEASPPQAHCTNAPRGVPSPRLVLVLRCPFRLQRNGNVVSEKGRGAGPSEKRSCWTIVFYEESDLGARLLFEISPT